jgi:cytochrome c oxidase cbb3-type subunit 3
MFSLIYLYRFQVVHTGPSPLQEYETAMNEAATEKEAYLLHAASKVDENSVIMLTDVAALGEGKKLFEASCSPCHGANAQGVVGPNLTDDFWLHEGGIKDVFKTIKYGVPERGMKAWKDDFSPVQISELASYIKSLRGSKPAGAKEPQGQEYKETIETADAVKSEKSIVTNP